MLQIRLRHRTLAAAVMSVILGCGPSSAAPVQRNPAVPVNSPAHLVVVELFQSQGCSSCPPADAMLNELAGHPEVLALSFAVTYWDQLGWKDTFGSPRFTERQQDYAGAGVGQVATPELIVNGAHAVLGSSRRDLDMAMAHDSVSGSDIAIAADGKSVQIGAAAKGRPSTVWLVRYDPRSHDVAIRAGENGGRTRPHRNIVRDLVRLGEWSGTARSFTLPAAHEAGLFNAILVENGRGGPIVAARKF